MRILIADDHPRMRDFIRRTLEPWGADIVEAADGGAAIAAFRSQQPDWTLLDLEMPVLDGLSATRAIRSIAPDARIALVTGYDTPPLRAAALMAGAREYILKSDLAALREILQLPAPSPS